MKLISQRATEIANEEAHQRVESAGTPTLASLMQACDEWQAAVVRNLESVNGRVNEFETQANPTIDTVKPLEPLEERY
jgi:hypothetical protein